MVEQKEAPTWNGRGKALEQEQDKDTNNGVDVGALFQQELISHVNSLDDTLTAYDHLRITDTTDIPDLEPIITIKGETIAAKGDFVVFSGGVKTGKSSIQDPIIAACIPTNGDIIDSIDDLEVKPNEQALAVIHIDTEQSRSKHKQKVQAIKRRTHLATLPDYFLSYNIKQLNIEDYRPTTTAILKAAQKKFTGIHLVVIDGIADYISDPNNTEESNAIVKYFEQVAIEFNCPVLCIIHTNPGGDKERGNLGSQCIRKAASVLSVKVDGDITFLEPKYLRNAGRGKVPTILFQYDTQKGYHVCCGTRTETGSTGGKPGNKSKLQGAVDQIFAPPKALGYTNIIKEIMNHFDIKQRTAVERWKEIQTLELVTQGPDKNWRKAE